MMTESLFLGELSFYVLCLMYSFIYLFIYNSEKLKR